MEKYVSFGIEEEIIECDINSTYQEFLSKIQTIFNLKNDSFTIVDLTETNFDDMMTIKDHFDVVRSEKDLALKRLNGKTEFDDIVTIKEAEDYFTVYGFKSDEYGNTPLGIASLYGYRHIVKFILEKNFDDVFQSNYNWMGPLHWASKYGCVDIVKLLLEQDFDNVQEVGNMRFIPLELATNAGHTDIVKLLEEDIERRKRENKHY